MAVLVLPDLPDLFAGAPEVIAEPSAPPPPPEDFKPCAPALPSAEPEERRRPSALAAPRLDRTGYRQWARAIAALLELMRRPRGSGHRRDVTLVAALPLPGHADVPVRALAWPLSILAERDLPGSGRSLLDEAQIGSPALQLAWPWIETAVTRTMPEGLSGGDGALAGVLARNALARGAFRSAAGLALTAVTRTAPALARGDIERGLPDGRADWLGDRLCLVARRPDGFILASDATMAVDRARRTGGVARLIGIVLRAARWLGQGLLFDASGPVLWTRVRRELDGFPHRPVAARRARRRIAGPGLHGPLRHIDYEPSGSRCRARGRDDRVRSGTAGRADHGDTGAQRRRRRPRSAGGGVMVIAIPKEQDQSTPLPTFNFHVDASLPGVNSGKPVCFGAFAEVSGLEATMEPKVIKVGGRNYGPI